MTRCIECDAVLTEKEIIWYPDRNDHETTCAKCREADYDYSEPDEYEPLDDLLDFLPLRED